MAAIKKFFEKRKMDAKFKMAGGGHKLTEETRSVRGHRSQGQSITCVKVNGWEYWGHCQLQVICLRSKVSRSPNIMKLIITILVLKIN